MAFTLKIAFLFFCLYSTSHALEPDVRFEVERNSANQLRLQAYEKNQRIFDETVTFSSTSPTFVFIENKNCVVQSVGNQLTWRYQGQDFSYLTFALNAQGDITLTDDTMGQGTRYEHYKSWGFKTNGTFNNQANSAFFKLKVQAHQIHNFSILKLFGYDFESSYYFNKGIMHFGDWEHVITPQSYLEYIMRIKTESTPLFQKNIIDDYGVIIADNGLRIIGLTHKIHGFVDASSLELDRASLDIHDELLVRAPMKGYAPGIHIQPTGNLHVDTIDHQVKIDHWNNQGSVF